MIVAAAKVVSSTDTNEKNAAEAGAAGISEFVGVALFSGIGLLLSLAVVILDQLTPGDWF
jgi:hypothetical protein